MNNTLPLILAILLCHSAHATTTCDDPEAHRIGRVVLDVQHALNHHDQPAALETIAKYGTDSRHYEMIRGWLTQRLLSAKSLHEATRNNPQRAAQLTKQIKFLESAIRRIDLE